MMIVVPPIRHKWLGDPEREKIPLTYPSELFLSFASGLKGEVARKRANH